MADLSGYTDTQILRLRTDVERERMSAHHDHNDYKRKAAKKRLAEIDKEIARRRHVNRGNRIKSATLPAP